MIIILTLKRGKTEAERDMAKTHSGFEPGTSCHTAKIYSIIPCMSTHKEDPLCSTGTSPGKVGVGWQP